jgi:hypothetical protein
LPLNALTSRNMVLIGTDQINKTYAVFRLIMIETMKNELPSA